MTQSEMINFGEKLKEYRKSKGLTQEALANILGVQKAAISKYEKGRIKKIPTHTLYELAIILEIPQKDLPANSENLFSNIDWPDIVKTYNKRVNLADSIIPLLFFTPESEEVTLIPNYLETQKYFILDKQLIDEQTLTQIKTYIDFILSQR